MEGSASFVLEEIVYPKHLNVYNEHKSYIDAEDLPKEVRDSAKIMIEAANRTFRKFDVEEDKWEDLGNILFRFSYMVMEEGGIRLDLDNDQISNFMDFVAELYEHFQKEVEIIEQEMRS